ncbi:hypothetical protein PMNALOAF_0097 [Methylobacterium adhaesivum]|jgi:hypothetical protein|uniref:3',5'-cyclic-nucleotide phosphodiesterase n=1 Tax=Methylobacterium adhaesivum TaxID=333297 RepID=A0ABT8BE32_9HYPH|nr:hypothetical protein [Methylobacterium adhaesivum]MDN3589805.1 hypothetical protein [Methylobacterium adhaesivum]GJD28865.1 hypothetical protein PMNALOAF_0097 [Methylobacterium adhaesivum]
MRVMTSRPLSLSTALKIAPLALVMLAAAPAQAQREDQGLQLGCANDYFRLCAGVDPNSQDADRCMERNRARLSPECKAAIGDYDRRTGGKSQK